MDELASPSSGAVSQRTAHPQRVDAASMLLGHQVGSTTGLEEALTYSAPARQASAPDQRVQRLQSCQCSWLRLPLPLLQRLAVQQQRLQQQLAAVQAAEEAAPGSGCKIQALLRT